MVIIISHLINVIKKNEQKTHSWLGGKTTQLAIYPAGANYKDFNFQWRVSTATVENEHSLFTPLPGFNRITMVLEGEMYLKHKGHHCKHLHPFEQDCYRGDWLTQSTGPVKNFNLIMATDEVTGKVKHFIIDKSSCIKILTNKNNKQRSQVSEIFYCLNGDLNIVVDGTSSIVLHEGDLLVFHRKDSSQLVNIELYNLNEITTEVIRTSIFYKE